MYCVACLNPTAPQLDTVHGLKAVQLLMTQSCGGMVVGAKVVGWGARVAGGGQAGASQGCD